MSDTGLAVGVALVSSVLSAGVTYVCIGKRKEGPGKVVGYVEGAKVVTMVKGLRKLEVVIRENDEVEAWQRLRKELGVSEQGYMVVKREGKIVRFRYSDLKDKESLEVETQSNDWVEVSNQLRKDGNTKFSLGNTTSRKAEYLEALRLYQQAYAILPPDGGEQAVSMRCLAKSNCAQVCLKLESYKFARQICTEVLEDDPRNLKTLYRRGLAARKCVPRTLANLTAALQDLEAAVEIANATQNDLIGDIRKEHNEVRQAIESMQPTKKQEVPDLASRSHDLD
eukprot:TRINITY_DN5896_c0_g1_i2.p1 TRINITY_DN5896_c0_g1~~TRINITY_DN5896_c0_g1_i2.p1  ORF type:complete len:282 (+),score=69.58 TRINITY_DN5896_c0_g1_i2:126-971(+)